MNSGPISIAPSGFWHGNDGPWSTLSMGFGTPAQSLNLLVSTSSTQPWVVASEACSGNATQDCATARGGLFDSNASSTWQDKGTYELEAELNLGIDEIGDFGIDSLTLGIPGSHAVTQNKQMLARIANDVFYLSSLGLYPAATNLTDFNHPYPSLIQNLKQQNLISSLSWSYTAGAYFQSSYNKYSLASLTLGGYDATRFDQSNITVPFGQDPTRELMVELRSIKSLDNSDLLLQSIISLIDSELPHIWLPIESCQIFEKVFHLVWDSAYELYLVNDSLHNTLISQNTTLLFELAANQASSETIVINLPYAAFDLQLTTDYPNVMSSTHYFPLKRAANQTQYTLGRAFLQQAYLIADYERSTFSVHQAVFPTTLKTDLRPISPPQETPSFTISVPPPLPSASLKPSLTVPNAPNNVTAISTSSPSHSATSTPASVPATFSPFTYAAIVLGAIAIIPTLFLLSRFICKRRRRKRLRSAVHHTAVTELPGVPHFRVRVRSSTRKLGSELDDLHPAKRKALNVDERRQELQGSAIEHQLEDKRASEKAVASVYERVLRRSGWLRQSGGFF